jgi:hypothetical protein
MARRIGVAAKGWQTGGEKRKARNDSTKMGHQNPLSPGSSIRWNSGHTNNTAQKQKTQANMVRKSSVGEGGSENLTEKNEEHTANHSTPFISGLEMRN